MNWTFTFLLCSHNYFPCVLLPGGKNAHEINLSVGGSLVVARWLPDTAQWKPWLASLASRLPSHYCVIWKMIQIGWSPLSKSSLIMWRLCLDRYQSWSTWSGLRWFHFFFFSFLSHENDSPQLFSAQALRVCWIIYISLSQVRLGYLISTSLIPIISHCLSSVRLSYTI